MGSLVRGLSLACASALALSACSDVPIDPEPADTAPADTSIDTGTDTGTDTGVDTAPVDTGTEVREAEAGCSGAFCPDDKICKAGDCVACLTDMECAAVDMGRRCFGGACKVAACNPKATPTGCTAAGAVCCPTETSMGVCYARAGETSCCGDSDCASVPKLTKCNLTLHACGCPAPTPGELHVSPTGVDSNPLRGNGSSSCPFKTIGEALFAAAGSTARMRIVLHTDATGSAATYGTGCSGGSPCDTTPLVIPATIDKGLVIEGSGATSADVVVTGDGGSIFDVRAPGVGFKKLTIKPTREATGGGGNGIIYNAPAGTMMVPEGSVADVVIKGKYATSAVAGTGTAILLSNAASPTLGPGLTLDGGILGVNITLNAHPTIVGTTAAPTTITSFGDNCLRATSTTAVVPGFTIKSTDASKSVRIKDCGSRAISFDSTAAPATPSSIQGAVIEKTPAGGAFDAIVVRTAAALTIDGVDILNVAGRGIVVDAGLSASKTVVNVKNVTITAPSGVGALFQGYATIDINKLVIDRGASIGVQLAGFAEVKATGLDLRDSAGVALSVGGNASLTSDTLAISGGLSHGLHVLGNATATAKNNDIRTVGASAVLVQGFAVATVDTSVIRASKAQGVRVLDNATLNFLAGDVRDSNGDGLRCEGSGILKLRDSSFLANKANGVYILGACEADLGTSTTGTNNVFNKTSLRNTTSGLCWNSTGTKPVPTGSTFSCNYSAPGCGTGSPLVTNSPTCAAARDVTAPTPGLTLLLFKCCYD